MAIIMAFDAMLSAGEGDEVKVQFGADEDSVFIDFAVGDDKDEITFAFDPADADKWVRAFQLAAELAAAGAEFNKEDAPSSQWMPCFGKHRRKAGHPFYSGVDDLERRDL